LRITPRQQGGLALFLMLHAGAARQDATRLGWQNVSGGMITGRHRPAQQDRRGKTGAPVTLPIHRARRARTCRRTAADPRRPALFLAHGAGGPTPPGASGTGSRAGPRRRPAHCSAHGLRKAAATRIAARGGTEREVMAFLAHATPTEGATYSRKADRARLAASAAARLAGTKEEQNQSNPLSNPSARLAKPASQPLKR
jgi:integrase